MILTAGYILWAIQRVYLGAEYKGPHPEAITPIEPREAAIATILLVFAIWFGIYPSVMLDVIDGSIAELVKAMDEGYQRVVDVTSVSLNQ